MHHRLLMIFRWTVVLCAPIGMLFAQPIDQGTNQRDQGVLADSQDLVWTGQPELVHRIQTIVDKAQSKNPQRIGLSVVDLTSGKPLIAYRANDDFHPASNIKLLTSAAALHVLGARHRWVTLIGTDRTQNASMGNLLIKGGGDPSLAMGDLSEWVLQLKSMGLSRIDGDLIIDATLFDSFGLPPGFSDKNQDGAYRASVSTINLNWNHVVVRVSDRGKSRGHIAVFPPNDYVKIVNKTRVKPKVKRPISLTQKVLKAHQNIVVKGQLKRGKSRQFRRRIGSPLRFFAAALRRQLAVNQIDFKGTIRFQAIEALPKILITHESKPLSTILKSVNSWSNNVCAEVLVLSLAHKLNRKTTFNNGLDIIRSFASDQLSWSDFFLTNGSGLFGDTRVKAHQMTDLLAYMYRQQDRYPDFRSSMAVAGSDGTMKRRLVNLKAAQVYAKTGTLDGVSGLSGYIRMGNDDMLAFSILQNDFTTNARPIRMLQDEIVRAVVELSMDGSTQ